MKFAGIVLMLIMLTDLPNEDTDYAGKKAYTLDSEQPDGGKTMEAKVLFLPGFILFLVCFMHFRSFTVIKTLQK